MNLPNKLTILRVLLIPFFMAFLLLGGEFFRAVAFVIFCIASITDFVDGFLARKNNDITNFGKFADPLADKLLIVAALVCLVELGITPAWIAFIIIAREFIVTGMRVIAISEGRVIAAGAAGKAKTVCQIAAVMIALIFGNSIVFGLPLAQISMIIAAIITIYSGVEYMVKNSDVLKF